MRRTVSRSISHTHSEKVIQLQYINTFLKNHTLKIHITIPKK